MQANPLVSVIINCFNGEKFLKDAIDSVFQQLYKNWEIIFFDNIKRLHQQFSLYQLIIFIICQFIFIISCKEIL